MSERALKIAAMRWLKEQPDVWCLKTHGGGYGRAGVPDILCCVRGSFLAIELKRPGEQPTKLQTRELHAIHDAQGFAYVARTLDEVKEFVELVRWVVVEREKSKPAR